MNLSKYLSVSEFNSIISNIFKAEEMLHNITILGEVSAFKVYAAHAYFTLKDSEGEISCTCFNYMKTYVPKAGESILVTGSPNFYAKKGSLSFNIDKIKPVGQGLLYVKLEELKKKLREEGLFDETHKKELPAFPNNICVITSLNGAVIRDIVTTIRLRNNIINIKVYDVRVQGDGAVGTIIKALKDVDKYNYDVVILARGGGSFEDLMPFNDEEIARTIYAMKTPIISAVGHETDFSICDFVADKRAATPTAAAEIIAYNVAEWRAYILKKAENISTLVFNYYMNMHNKVNANINQISYESRLILDQNMARINALMKKSTENINTIYVKKSHIIDKLITSLDANSPIKILKNGYFRIGLNGLPIYSVKQLKIDDSINIIGGDGILHAKVTDILEVYDEV